MISHLPQDLDERLELALSGIRNREIPEFPGGPIGFPPATVQPSRTVLGWWRVPAVRRIFGTALACVVLVVVLLNLRGSGTVVLADVVQAVARTKSVSFVMKQQTKGKTLQEFRCWLDEEHVRVEGPGDQVLITSGAGGIRLDREHKQWSQVPTSTSAHKDSVPSPIVQLRQAKSDKAKFIATEEIEGRKTDKFQMPIQSPSLFHEDQQYGFGAEFELIVWVDVETLLPLRIEIRHPQQPSRIVFKQLKWNEKLDGSLFDTSIPAGFSEKSEPRRDR